MLNTKEQEEMRAYVRKITSEGTSSDAAGAFATPAAFVGDEDAEGSELGTEAGTPYKLKPSKKKKNFVKLHEISYKAFANEEIGSPTQKINRRILEVARSVREISRALDHSLKLREEKTDPEQSPYWSRTNEAILMIHKRLAEVIEKTERLANLNELAGNQLQKKLYSLIKAAGVSIDIQDIHCVDKSNGNYECDVFINGEPTSLDLQQDKLIFQGYEEEEVLGNPFKASETQAIVSKLQKLLPR